jgi:hypothetical protein
MPAPRTAHRHTEVFAALERSGHAGDRVDHGAPVGVRGPVHRGPAGDEDGC